jgi:hypothetical protein
VSLDGSFALNHLYAADGVYGVTVAATAPGDITSTGRFLVNVSDPSPTGRARSVFVRSLYHDLLGRSPEPAGLVFWKQILANNVRPTAVARSIGRSQEAMRYDSLGRGSSRSVLMTLRGAITASRLVT